MNKTSLNNCLHDNLLKRRKFVSSVVTALSGSALLMIPGAGIAEKLQQPEKELTIQQVINIIIKSIPDSPF